MIFFLGHIVSDSVLACFGNVSKKFEIYFIYLSMTPKFKDARNFKTYLISEKPINFEKTYFEIENNFDNLGFKVFKNSNMIWKLSKAT